MRRAILLLMAAAGLALVMLPVATALAFSPPDRPGPPPAMPAVLVGVPRQAPQAPPARVALVPQVAQAPRAPATPTPPGINLNINGTDPGKGRPSTPLVIVLGLTVLSAAPSVLLLCTAFTKVFMVLGITRNALGLTSMPPNQVLAGLALFLSMFIMGPTLSAMNDAGVQPYLKGDKSQSVAFRDGVQPLRDFMAKVTREDELALMIKVSGEAKPRNIDDVPLTTLIPAFVLSEVRAAFIIGFVIFIPFLIIDLVVAASLMSLGMMMLPPVTVALPFKLLLFVLVNGWSLIISALVGSY
ncbi:flagellar type III secretion system pore protein FliP [Actinoplanes rectilineatus]|uniref:flagellar type III secretion system pore protein FliP n=1 Tax=Actinoplanes rectilineatus TaxID=113571 RepID=UPI0005F2BD1A|nr:flagellar type III secretion system pore protein FliP [Actinoplanes rectilineatus]